MATHPTGQWALEQVMNSETPVDAEEPGFYLPQDLTTGPTLPSFCLKPARPKPTFPNQIPPAFVWFLAVNQPSSWEPFSSDPHSLLRFFQPIIYGRYCLDLP